MEMILKSKNKFNNIFKTKICIELHSWGRKVNLWNKNKYDITYILIRTKRFNNFSCNLYSVYSDIKQAPLYFYSQNFIN